MLRLRCRQTAGKAHLHWVLWPWALADYYYYCYWYHPRAESLMILVSRGPQAHWPVAEVGTEAGEGPCVAGWGEGWGWGREASW